MFKIGDRVKCVLPGCDCGGQQGVIVREDPRDPTFPFAVAFDGEEGGEGSESWVFFDGIALVDVVDADLTPTQTPAQTPALEGPHE